MADERPIELTPEQLREAILCRSGDEAATPGQGPQIAGFLYWCKHYAYIQDKDEGRAVPFDPYPCQQELAALVVAGAWLRILKARRLGITWLFALYAVWLTNFWPEKEFAHLVHKQRPFGHNFIKYCLYVRKSMPDWMLIGINAQSKDRLEFSHGSLIQTYTATPGAVDSIGADFVFIDEAPKIENLRAGNLQEVIRSVEPTVETSRGTVCMAGTSDGPRGNFYHDWMAFKKNGKGKYRNIFYGWQSRPDRTHEWYEQEKQDHPEDPDHMPRNYPETEEEAWQRTTGRIYPRFTNAQHVGRYYEDGLFHSGEHHDRPAWQSSAWRKWRSIDWGGADPFVCQWLAEVPGDGPMLTVDPRCHHTIRELMAYRRKGGSSYLIDHQDSHCPDCLRMAVVTFHLRGHVHIYNELYVEQPSDHGQELPDLAEQILYISGDEAYESTVADRGRKDSIGLMCRYLRQSGGPRLPVVAHLAPPGAERDMQRQEVEQGINRVNVLIVGTHDLYPTRPRDEALERFEELRRHPPIAGAGITLEHHLATKSTIERAERRMEELMGGRRLARMRRRMFRRGRSGRWR